MSIENDFLPLGTGVGANVETQATYASDPTRTQGQQPGVASSAFNNKALRQATYFVSQLAQYLANVNNADVLDNATPAQLLAGIVNGFQYLPPVPSILTSGSGTFNLTYVFNIASGNATAAAVYADSASTHFTVVNTISSGLQLQATGGTAPVTGTGALVLTKVSGTGDATLTYYAVRAPVSLEIEMVGGGGGGQFGFGSTSNATGGGNTTFGTSFLSAGGGSPGSGSGEGGAGGIASVTSPPTGSSFLSINGSAGASAGATLGLNIENGGSGGCSPFGGNGTGGNGSVNTGTDAATNSGSGGGGGLMTPASNGPYAGGGGGAGGYIKGVIPSPASSYAYAIGTAGGKGVGTFNGGNGGSVVIRLVQRYQ